MVFVIAQNYADAKVHIITVGNRELFWIKMIDVQNGLGIKNISDLVRKNIQGRYETKNPTKEQVKKYKRSLKEISKEPTYDSKIKYVHSNLMEIIIKNRRGVKKCNDGMNRMEKEKQSEDFRTCLGFKEHDIIQRKEYSMNLKIKKVFPNGMIEEQYYVLGDYMDLAFPVHKLGIEIDENGHMDKSEAEEKERQKIIEKEKVSRLLELIQTEKTLMTLSKFVEYEITLSKQPKK